MKKFISNKKIYTVIGIILLILIWELVSLIISKNTLLFPSPLLTFKETINVLSNSYIYESILYSFLKMLIGFAASLIIALIFGSIAAFIEPFRKINEPFITLLKSIPTASLLFLFLVLVGSSYSPIFVVILVAYPILYESVIGGLKNIPSNIRDSLKLEGESKANSILRVKIPLAASYISVGIVSSFALAFKVEIMAEILTGNTQKGIGSAIKMAQMNNPTNMTPIFAYSLIAIVFIELITFISKLINKRIKQKL